MSAISRLISMENGTSKPELGGMGVGVTFLKSEERLSGAAVQGVEGRESQVMSSSLILPCIKSLLFTL